MVAFYHRTIRTSAAHESDVPLGDEGRRLESIFYCETLFNSIVRTRSKSGSF